MLRTGKDYNNFEILNCVYTIRNVEMMVSMLLLQEGWVVRRWPIVVGRQGWSTMEICPPWWERHRIHHVDALIILCPR